MSIYTPDDGRFSYTVKLNRLSVGKCTHKTPMDWIGSYHLLGVYIYIYTGIRGGMHHWVTWSITRICSRKHIL